MKHHLACLSVGCLFLFTVSVQAATNSQQHNKQARLLPEFIAHYAITKYDIKLAEAIYRLRYTANGYRISQQTRLYGIAALFRNDTVDASSLVDKHNGRLWLKTFTYRQTGREKNRNEDIRLNHTNNRTTITGISRSKPVNIHTQGPVWDILSFQIPLMIQARETINQYPYMAVINGELDKYTFNLRNKKQYYFAGKSWQLLEMVRSNKNKTRVLHVWLAPALHNLPVIVENYRDGKLNSRMQLESVQFDNQPVINAKTDDDSDE